MICRLQGQFGSFAKQNGDGNSEYLAWQQSRYMVLSQKACVGSNTTFKLTSRNCSIFPPVSDMSRRGKSPMLTSPGARSDLRGFGIGPLSFRPLTWTKASSKVMAPSCSPFSRLKPSTNAVVMLAMMEQDAEGQKQVLSEDLVGMAARLICEKMHI